MTQDEENKEITEYMRRTLKCPDCASTGFYDGPCGGASQNISCAGCGSRFNTSPFGIDRISHAPCPPGCIPAAFEEVGEWGSPFDKFASVRDVAQRGIARFFDALGNLIPT